MLEDASGSVSRAQIPAARFENQDDADRVGRKLEDLGYDAREISFISDPRKCSFTFDGIGNTAREVPAVGIAGGGAVGAALSVAVGLVDAGGLLLLGPIGLVAGAALGGVSGLLLGLGLESDRAVACVEAVNDGSVVTTVQAHAGDSAAACSALSCDLIAVECSGSFHAASLDLPRPA